MISTAEFILVAFLIILLSYVVMIIVFSWFWGKENSVTTPSSIETKTITVIIPVRNEENNLAKCLDSLMNQDYPKDKFSVVVAENGSMDNTIEIAKKYAETFSNIYFFQVVCNAEMHAKKKAITQAIGSSSSEYIILTDADCTHSPQWLSVMASRMEQKKCAMLSGPVISKNENGFVSKLIQLDHLSLMASGGASILSGRPLMCSAANLAFRREDFFVVEGYKGYETLSSGDDVFLMHNFKKKKLNIDFIKSYDVIIETAGSSAISSFFSQRSRWASKSKHYPGFFPKAIALLVLFASVLVIASYILILLNPMQYLILLAVPILKMIVDFVFLFQASSFVRRKNLMWFFIPTFLLYPFYVLTTFVISIFSKPQWKGTPVSK
ncbi:MAG: glycosyltransferase [Bacteroidota bacterium]